MSEALKLLVTLLVEALRLVRIIGGTKVLEVVVLTYLFFESRRC